MKFRRFLVGFLLFPVLPFIAVDLLFFARGVDAFNSFQRVDGVVVAVNRVDIDVRVTKHGSQGAVYQRRVRPQVTYRFSLDGQERTSTRFFLLDSDDLSDTTEEVDRKGSLTSRISREYPVGAQVHVVVARREPELSFLEVGIGAVYRSLTLWLGFYVIGSTLMGVGYLISNIRRVPRRSRRQH